jgi:hypothetical protein
VQDVFKGRQGGVGVGGKLEAGALKPGSKLLVVPGCAAASVKSVDTNGQVCVCLCVCVCVCGCGCGCGCVWAAVCLQHLLTAGFWGTASGS